MKKTRTEITRKCLERWTVELGLLPRSQRQPMTYFATRRDTLLNYQCKNSQYHPSFLNFFNRDGQKTRISDSGLR